MQTFLFSSRSTASGNGMGTAGRKLPYKTCASRAPWRSPVGRATEVALRETRSGSGRPAEGGRRRFPVRRTIEVVLSLEERRQALWLPRRALERALGPSPDEDPAGPFEREPLPPVFDEKRGAFVTLRRFPGEQLRGCIGYPLPVLPLRTALARAAVAAGLEDPRFAPVRVAELSRLAIEVSVLTVPVPVHVTVPAQRVAAVRVGRDGLIVDGFGASGLLLPQVAPEQGWTAEEFLAGTCEKAGLPRSAWRDPRVVVRRFEAEVFRERSPGGEPMAEGPEVTMSDEPSAPRT